jgi:hypothetical protein
MWLLRAHCSLSIPRCKKRLSQRPRSQMAMKGSGGDGKDGDPLYEAPNGFLAEDRS